MPTSSAQPIDDDADSGDTDNDKDLDMPPPVINEAPPFAMNLRTAAAAAEKIAAALQAGGVCRQVHIAGGVRRRKPEGIHDIDIVIVPEAEPPGGPGLHAPRWTQRFVSFINDCDLWRPADLKPDDQLLLGGVDAPASSITPFSRKIALRSAKTPALKIELWCAVPENVGATLLIRTGPAAFAKLLVTAAHYEGLGLTGELRQRFEDGDRSCPRYYFAGGFLRMDDPARGDAGVQISTPREGDVFTALNLAYIAPEDRTEQALRREINRTHPRPAARASRPRSGGGAA